MSENGQPQVNNGQQNTETKQNSHVDFDRQVLELGRRKKELDAREKSLGDAMTWDKIQEFAKKDKMEFLKRLGLDAKHFQEDDNDPQTALRKEIEAIKAERQKEIQERSLNEKRQRLKSAIGAKADNYELLTMLGLEDSLFDHINEQESQGLDVSDPYQFADQFENTLFERFKPVLGAKKFAELIGQSRKPEEKKKNPLEANSTLTGNMDRQGRSESQDTELDHETRLRRAMNILQWK